MGILDILDYLNSEITSGKYVICVFVCIATTVKLYRRKYKTINSSKNVYFKLATGLKIHNVEKIYQFIAKLQLFHRKIEA